MLEKVSEQPCSLIASNPLVNAVAWNIPIYSVTSFQKWLEKKLVLLDEKQPNNSSNVRVFTRTYLKIESLCNGYRPEFKEVNKWPRITLTTALGSCPFDKPYKQKVEKRPSAPKAHKENQQKKKRAGGGYCELCGLNYNALAQHVLSDTHVKAVSDKTQYVELDNYIRITRSMDEFVAEHQTRNSSSSSNRHSGLKYANNVDSMGDPLYAMPPLSNDTVRVTRSFTNTNVSAGESAGNIVKGNGLSRSYLKRTHFPASTVVSLPIEENKTPIKLTFPNMQSKCPLLSENSHYLRSKRNLFVQNDLTCLTNGIIEGNKMKSPNAQCNGTSPKDSSVDGIRRIHDLRKPFKKRIKIVKNNSSEEVQHSSKTETKPNLNGILLKKRLSYEEKFLEESKSILGTDVKRHKLRSTEFFCRTEAPPGQPPATTLTAATNMEDSSNVKPITKKRVRKISPLTLLSMEAENFMFNHIRNNHDSDSTESNEPREEGSKSTKNEKTENEEQKNLEGCMPPKKRKRRNQAEAFIHDNIDYYKFQLPATRLRYSTVTSELFEENPCCSKATSPKVPLEEGKDKYLKRTTKVSRAFHNESLCSSEELSYSSDVKKRHDGKLLGEPTPDADDCQPSTSASTIPDRVAMSYNGVSFSFEKVPSHDLWYKTFDRQDTFKESPLPFFHQYPKVILPCDLSNHESNDSQPTKKRRNVAPNIAAIIDPSNPRKSPRCHPSTLAILSDVTSRSKSRELRRVPRSSYSENSTENLSAEEEEAASEPSVAPKIEEQREDVEVLANNIDKHFVELFSSQNDDVFAIKIKQEAGETCSDPFLEIKNSTGYDLCMDIDPCVLSDPEAMNVSFDLDNVYSKDFLTLLEESKYCDSMERATEVRLPPQNHLLRDSCNNSDTGSCNSVLLGFTEDGIPIDRKNRRKRKKPNLTGWPHDKRKRRIPEPQSSPARPEPEPEVRKTRSSSHSRVTRSETSENCAESEVKIEPKSENSGTEEPVDGTEPSSSGLSQRRSVRIRRSNYAGEHFR